VSSVLNAKCKNVDNCTQTPLKAGIRTYYTIQMHAAVKTGAALKSLGEKICDIKGGSQEMATSIILRFISF